MKTETTYLKHYRLVESARAAGRLVEPAGKDLGRVLDCLGVRRGTTLLRAAVVLFGRRFLPDFPQCELRLARFRGVDKTEFLDQRQIHAPAFKLLLQRYRTTTSGLAALQTPSGARP
jgi:ATP-dependent DNA helicase RecG